MLPYWWTHFTQKYVGDVLLFAVFDPVVKDNWDQHLQRMVDFWSTLLL
jgi:hemoglobin